MTKLVSRFANDESGATAIEYGLIAAIVGVGLVTSLTSLSGGLTTQFTGMGTTIGGAN